MSPTTEPRTAVLLPGGNYGTAAPLLMYAGIVAETRGAELERVSWKWSGPPPADWLDLARLVPAQVESVLDRLAGEAPGSTPLVVGKSLGTCAATVVADRGLPAVWLTPLLTVDWVVEAIRRTTAPCLLVGGTGDELWDGNVARELSPHVLEVDGADHGMFVPGPLAGSAEVLGRVATAVEGFLDDVVWPAATR